ncbi:hypothetical protein [Acidovorax sp. Root219]|uniref:hypothetical protein n=1 Tax=Acidovorax sp. Root219 TaxID=1736493 RepID=UPI00070FBF14|nr:hypothetical protein [Acidovorax sp. Root219]KRC19975.1 hypothetical protein ASE28_29060 [Acidovorax sp. Root219]
MLTNHSNAHRARRAPGRSRGFGLVQVLLLISVMAGLATIGYLQWRERSAVNTARQERQALSQADRALIAYVTVAGSLPCPDIDRDGVADCGAGNQSGWLPTVTMALAGVDAGVDVGQLRYLVQRGTGTNSLTVLDDSWRPLEYDETGRTFATMRETTATGGTYTANVLTLPDFCQRLDAGRAIAPAAGMAEVNATPVRTVAYALVHPGNGDANGDGNLFDGANTGSDSMVEDPGRRPVLALYNDIVLERSHASLLSAFHCHPLIDSINTMALGVDVIEQVHGMRTDNIASAKEAVAFAALGAAITAVETGALVLETISDAANTVVDTVTCAASLGLAVNACAAIGIHATATALSGGVIYLNIASIAANVVAAVMAGNALALADGSADLSAVCPTIDLSSSVNAAKTEWDNAIAARQAKQAAVTSKTNDVNNADTNRTNAINLLIAYVRAGATSTNIDDRVATLQTAATTWNDYTAAKTNADYRIADYQAAVTSWSGEVTSYGNMITNRTALLAQLNTDIASLNAQIAVATDPVAKAALQKTMLEKTSQRTLLNDPVALQAEYDKAVTERNNAQTNLATAQSDLAAAQANLGPAATAFQTAYNALVDAGPYRRFNGATEIQPGCSLSNGLCPLGPVNTSSNVLAGVVDLFGGSRTSPDPNAKFLLPIRLRKELAILQSELTVAQKRETDAQAIYQQLKTQQDNPPPCNITNNGAVTPMPIERAMEILLRADQKGGIR